jgi:hypothetical protein
VGQRIDRLLRDRLTTRDPEKPVLKKGAFQWRRDGGPSLRTSDIRDLQPQGEPRTDGDALTYRLDDNRQVTVRRSTTDKNAPYPTMDVQQRIVRPGVRDEWRTIHKIRYLLTD